MGTTETDMGKRGDVGDRQLSRGNVLGQQKLKGSWSSMWANTRLSTCLSYTMNTIFGTIIRALGASIATVIQPILPRSYAHKQSDQGLILSELERGRGIEWWVLVSER